MGYFESSDTQNGDDVVKDKRPRILCLHGGGVNSEIFATQCRALIKQLSEFRLVFADAPFTSEAGPGILPTFKDFGPFRRWLRWKSSQPELSDDEAATALVKAIEDCKASDAGSGKWLGILGFSQGAKIAGSLLYNQQRGGEGDYKFGVLMAGRSPFVNLGREPHMSLIGAGVISRSASELPLPEKKLQIPTVHVLGLRDADVEWHRSMAHGFCEDPRIVEWDGGHRIPIKPVDVTAVTDEIHAIVEELELL
ncbi:hypothetical protein VHEMI01653 [[Torrubiella] hemipterigena]|uniref:Serine hydrolase domain-containing protein n=1 Tax=[Torrubiella] hemipterigena TaxID=1531966 RepID=A0A0A1T5F3_9HYPO|nr:hypothetical protein VHEMI01653 [[Torrubiella] hemipterigena]